MFILKVASVDASEELNVGVLFATFLNRLEIGFVPKPHRVQVTILATNYDRWVRSLSLVLDFRILVELIKNFLQIIHILENSTLVLAIFLGSELIHKILDRQVPESFSALLVFSDYFIKLVLSDPRSLLLLSGGLRGALWSRTTFGQGARPYGSCTFCLTRLVSEEVVYIDFPYCVWS